MKCNQCGGSYIIKHGDLQLSDDYVGPFTVEAVEYLECDGCGDLAYPPETLKKIEHARKTALEDTLQSLPLKDFVSGAEAAAMLGISRQALHKHRRIRRGFIFQTQFSDKTVYLKKSVEHFRDSGDGRFQLVEPVREAHYTSGEKSTRIVVVYVREPLASEIPKASPKDWSQNIVAGRRTPYARRQE